MIRQKQLILFSGLLLFCAFTFAGTAVIVHPDTTVLKKLNVNRAYLGYAKTFPSGHLMQLLDQPEGSIHREMFYRTIVRQTTAQSKQHWKRLTLNKKRKPPLVLNDERAIRNEVASTPGAIGYIDEALVDSTVKVVFTLP